MARDPELIAHQEWLGYLQPVGLVVSPPALAAAGAFPNKNIIPDHARFLDCVENILLEGESDTRPAIRQFARLRPTFSAGNRPIWSGPRRRTAPGFAGSHADRVQRDAPSDLRRPGILERGGSRAEVAPAVPEGQDRDQPR